MPILHLSHAKFFSGNILVTNLPSLELSLSFVNVQKILFWTSNLPWAGTSQHYKYWEKIFLDDRVSVIAYNTYINDLYSLCYKNPIIVSERLNYEEIQKCL
jgi:hypothetical protein